jgi:hypothetical protein
MPLEYTGEQWGGGKIEVVLFCLGTDFRMVDIDMFSLFYCIYSFVAPFERDKSPNMPAFAFFYRAFF